jgi:hypothetical protein
MAYKSFTHWLTENTDIFGFEAEGDPSDYDPLPPKLRDLPVDSFDIDELTRNLACYDLGVKKPTIKFVGEVRWGDGPGSMRVAIGSRLNLLIEKKGTDLEGNDIWYTHKVYQINRAGYGGYETHVLQDLLSELKRIDELPLPSAQHEYKTLENLVTSIANVYRRTAKVIFLHEGIRKLDDNNYIIRLGVRGSGVEHQDQRRVLENQTYINFTPRSGVIRIFNYNIESPTGNAPQWKIMPKDIDFNFATSQSRDEIIEALATFIHWY